MARLRSLVFFAVLILAFAFSLLLGLENSEPATLGLLKWRTPAYPVFYWVAGSLAVGGIAGFALAGGFGFRRMVLVRRLRQELEAAQRAVRDGQQSASKD